MIFKVEETIGGRNLSIEVGKLAKQADGAALVQYGGTVVLVTAVSDKPREGIDFFPLTTEYREMTYAAGKFPGGFMKREGRPTTKELVTMRLTDRPLRPLFPEGYFDEVQVMAWVLSADKQNDPDLLSLIGSSAALSVSSIPFNGPTGAARVGRIDGEYILNPTHADLAESDMEIIVAATEEAVVMVEASAKEVSEEDMLKGITFAHEAIKDVIKMQRDLVTQCGREKQPVPETDCDESLYEAIRSQVIDKLREYNQIPGKKDRSSAISELRKSCVEQYCDENNESAPTESAVKTVFERILKEVVRELILTEGKRSDGRGLTDIRPISCEVGILPRTHGSALFTRGETQALVNVTLGTSTDEQKVDGLQDEYTKKFTVHYNFPPFCTGEVKMYRGPGRREIGHGMLAERALQTVIPPESKFPYTIRVVSDILESNGSSSMATVCGGTLCLMDAGVPIKQPVAGIAMGLIKEGDEVRVLSDILGDEDHFGDMDFKVAGTQRGITALQMDIKVSGLTEEIMRSALEQAREGRMHILRQMLMAISEPRKDISIYAPRLTQIKIDPDKIGLVIGAGGKTIKAIQDETGANIEIEDDGTVSISASEASSMEKAKDQIQRMTEDVEVGKTYLGKVISIKDFGAFVEILPGQDGLVHISELADSYVEKVSDVVKVGQELKVKVIAIDEQNRVKLSRKAVLRDEQ